MKIEKKSTATSFLREGDQITVAVTHEIKIGGESSWVRYEGSSKIQGETSEEASQRVINHVSQEVMKAVYETVEKVRSN